MKRHPDESYDVQDDDGGRGNRLPVVVVGVGSAVVVTLAAGLVALSLNGSGEEEIVSTTSEAAVVTSLGNPVTGGAEAVDAALPWATQALDGSIGAPIGLGGAGADEIPPRVLEAYRSAEASMAGQAPGCRLPWWLLAGVGKVQSDHAAGGQVDGSGTASVRIVGPRLDGTVVGGRLIRDTDSGELDGDLTFDRGVGPMLVLPQTWGLIGLDGNGDGQIDVSNVDDSAFSVGALLCSADEDLTTPRGLARGLVRMDDGQHFAGEVLPWAAHYRSTYGDTAPTEAATDATTGTDETAQPTSAPTPGAPTPTAEVGPGFTTQATTEPASTTPPEAPVPPARATTAPTGAGPAAPAPRGTTPAAPAGTPSAPARTPAAPAPSRTTAAPARPGPSPERTTQTPRETPSQTPRTTPSRGTSTPTADRATPSPERTRATRERTRETRERPRSTPTRTPSATPTQSESRRPTPRESDSPRRSRDRAPSESSSPGGSTATEAARESSSSGDSRGNERSRERSDSRDNERSRERSDSRGNERSRERSNSRDDERQERSRGGERQRDSGRGGSDRHDDD